LPILGNPTINNGVRTNCLTGAAQTDAAGDPISCDFSFSGCFDPNNTFTIRGYSNVTLGSNSGYHITWGRPCNIPSAPIGGIYRGGAGGQGANLAYDLNPSAAATGYPSLVSSLPQTTLHTEYTDCGAPGGCYNTFTDMYLHEVSDPSLLPTNSTNGGQAQTQYLNTINGISQNDTKLWNFNWWHGGIPSCFNTGEQVTGGTYMGSTSIEPGKNVDIYMRREGFSGNNFAYLAFVFNPAQTNHNMDVNAYVNWATSTATGPGTFADIIWNNPNGVRQTIAGQMANPPTLAGVTPLSRTLRWPAGDMAMDGVQHGHEWWGVNPSGAVAKICHQRLGFTVDGKEFGKVTSTCPDCSASSLQASASAYISGQTIQLTPNVVDGQGNALSADTYAVTLEAPNGDTYPAIFSNGRWRYIVPTECMDGTWSASVNAIGCTPCELETFEVTGCNPIVSENCTNGPIITVATGDGFVEGCCPQVIPDADNPECPERGAVYKYSITGCEDCGDFHYEYGDGYQQPRVQIGGGRMCIGPLADRSPWCVELMCKVNAPDVAPC